MSAARAAEAPSDPLALVTDDRIAAFRRDGAVWIPGLLAPEWLTLLEAGLERNMANPGPRGFWHFGGEPGQFWDDYCNYDAIPEFRQALAESPIAAVMAKLFQSREVWLFCDQIFVKEGGYSRRTPWHQDSPYWLAEGEQLATMWIALDRLTEAETLEVVAGSHRFPLYQQNVAESGEYIRQAAKSGAALPAQAAARQPDIDGEREKWPIISWPSRPGDVLVFHPTALHGGAEMREGGRRRSLSLRFFGDDARYVVRDIPPDPPFPGVAETHEPGDPLRHAWFPQVYPRRG
jgi:ectoine hydroxylase-related dioxygenase (phytanoyl-CoA dioxygenase family)